MSPDTKGIARRFIDEAFNSGNLQVVDELVAPEFVNHDASLPEPIVGIEAHEGEHPRWSARGTNQQT